MTNSDPQHSSADVDFNGCEQAWKYFYVFPACLLAFWHSGGCGYSGTAVGGCGPDAKKAAYRGKEFSF